MAVAVGPSTFCNATRRQIRRSPSKSGDGCSEAVLEGDAHVNAGEAIRPEILLIWVAWEIMSRGSPITD